MFLSRFHHGSLELRLLYWELIQALLPSCPFGWRYHFILLWFRACSLPFYPCFSVLFWYFVIACFFIFVLLALLREEFCLALLTCHLFCLVFFLVLWLFFVQVYFCGNVVVVLFIFFCFYCFFVVWCCYFYFLSLCCLSHQFRRYSFSICCRSYCHFWLCSNLVLLLYVG